MYIGNFVKSMDMKQIFEKCLDKKTVITETQLMLTKNKSWKQHLVYLFIIDNRAGKLHPSWVAYVIPVSR